MEINFFEIVKPMIQEPGLLDEKIKEYLSDFDHPLPSDYLAIFKITNGVKGIISGWYIDLWKIDELKELNNAYAVQEFIPGIFLIGSNGGGTAYGLDYRNNPPSYVEVPFIGMSFDEIQECGNSFLEFLMHFKNNQHNYHFSIH
jgi:hypothetical protein